MPKAIGVLRLIVALIVTPLLCYGAYLREVSLEPLLGGAGILFYGVGFVWLLVLLIISGLISRRLKIRLTAWPVLTLCAIMGVVFELVGSSGSEGAVIEALPRWLNTPFLADPLLFNLLMGIVFVIIGGLSFRLLPASAGERR